MSAVESPRTEPVESERVDPHTRFAGQWDSYVNDSESVVEPCPACGSERIDGWMTEGAIGVVGRCVDCSEVYDIETEGSA